MPQVSRGIRATLLSLPSIYSLFVGLVGSESSRSKFVRDYIRAQAGDRILDIGCGPADLFPFLPDVEYIGFDASQDYINTAREKYSRSNNHHTQIPPTFICERVEASNLKKQAYFDIVLAIGILHHLDDWEAHSLFELAKVALKPGGRLVTFDGVYVPNQSPCARWIISKDRGQNVRTREGYLNIANRVFSDISVNIRHDLLRIPYTHLILECTK